MKVLRAGAKEDHERGRPNVLVVIQAFHNHLQQNQGEKIVSNFTNTSKMIPAIVVSVDKALNEHKTVESENPERFRQFCHEIAVMAGYKALKINVELLDFLSDILIDSPPTV